MIDRLDKEVFTETVQLRRLYTEARRRLGLRHKPLTPPVIGMRSVR